MKIIHSFWTRPLLKQGTDRTYNKIAGGWSDRIYNYMSWALSCLQLKEFYEEVELITDRSGRDLLRDTLKLPYTNVRVVLDRLTPYHHGLWALGKLVSYEMQDKPFIHVDGDVYIWDRFAPEIENAALVAQNEEHETHYKAVLAEINKHNLETPDAIRWFEGSGHPFSSCNAGIIGGNDVSFIKQWVKEAFAFVDRNLPALNKMNTSSLNIYFEQYLFHCMAKQQGIPIRYLLHNIDAEFSGLADFNLAPHKRKFIHPVGIYKQHEQKGTELSEQLRAHHPHYYYRIQKLVSDHTI